MKKENNQYANLINCETPEEVLQSVKQWYSNISEKEHIIRSIIIDLHVNIEFQMKYILYEHMISLVAEFGGQKEKYIKQKKALENKINKMSFMNVYNLLKPCLDAYNVSEFSDIPEINKTRNKLAHGDLKNISYKDRNPFTSHDCLAQIFFDSWAIRKMLRKFYGRMIEDPRLRVKSFAEYYYEHELLELNEKKEKKRPL